jgi:hypothetical protein
VLAFDWNYQYLTKLILSVSNSLVHLLNPQSSLKILKPISTIQFEASLFLAELFTTKINFQLWINFVSLLIFIVRLIVALLV